MSNPDTRAVRTRLATAGSRRSKAEVERSAASDALATAVRDAARAGMKPGAIAANAGVSRQTVHTILRNSST